MHTACAICMRLRGGISRTVAMLNQERTCHSVHRGEQAGKGGPTFRAIKLVARRIRSQRQQQQWHDKLRCRVRPQSGRCCSSTCQARPRETAQITWQSHALPCITNELLPSAACMHAELELTRASRVAISACVLRNSKIPNRQCFC